MIGNAKLAEVESVQEHFYLGNKVNGLGRKYFIFLTILFCEK